MPEKEPTLREQLEELSEKLDRAYEAEMLAMIDAYHQWMEAHPLPSSLFEQKKQP